jgi:hypothetical protein
MTSPDGFTHIGEIVPSVVKEISRRAELHTRLEAERGRNVSDEEFLAIAEQDGEQL